MIITATGILAYVGHTGNLYEIVGGKSGQINMREL